MPITGNPKVGMAVAAYLRSESEQQAMALKCLVASVQAQTYPNWHLQVTHDGPYPHDHGMLTYMSQWDQEARVKVVETDVRKQEFGHPHRQKAVTALIDLGCEWIGLTNQDNYYAPVYFEWLLSAAQTHKAQFAYCDMVRSHKLWKPMGTSIRRGHIDLGGFLVHRSLAAKIKFDNFTFIGDWDYIRRLTGAAKNVIKVPATLFTHN